MRGMRFILVCLFFVCFRSAAEDREPSGNEILARVDEALYSAKDKEIKMKFILVDRNGGERTRELDALERGNDHRLMRFTAPADQKGIAFLSLPGGIMYIYLPAFGKARRIASNIKNRNFAGTELSYEDLEAKAYAPRWSAEIMENNEESYRLALTPREGVDSEYSRLVVDVRKDNFYPVRIDYFDKAGKPYKKMERKKIKQINGYWEAMESVMENLHNGNKTILVIEEVKFDAGIPEDRFTERYLIR